MPFDEYVYLNNTILKINNAVKGLTFTKNIFHSEKCFHVESYAFRWLELPHVYNLQMNFYIKKIILSSIIKTDANLQARKLLRVLALTFSVDRNWKDYIEFKWLLLRNSVLYIVVDNSSRQNDARLYKNVIPPRIEYCCQGISSTSDMSLEFIFFFFKFQSNLSKLTSPDFASQPQ